MSSLRPVLRVVVVLGVLATALAAAAGAADGLLAWAAAPQGEWPQSGLDRLQAAALVATLLAGMVALVRLALAGLRVPRPPEHHAAVEQLRTEVRTDALTGLANRRAFDDDLAAAMADRNRTGSVFSLMAIDLDGLKEINDTRGHQAGDVRLRWIASRLLAAVGGRGTVYRTGGDEFMVLLPRTRALHALELAQAIQRATTSPGAAARALSIGVSETRGTDHRHELVRQADLALYEAKRENLPAAPYRPELEAGPGGLEYRPRQNVAARALVRALAARDPDAAAHSETVARLAAATAARQGIAGRRLEQLRLAALLHDIGKLALPDALLGGGERLGDHERVPLRRHVALGRDLVAAAGFVDESTWVLHHHERYDGVGYPDALRETEIPLESRIIAVADAFAALTVGSGGDGVSVDEALEVLEELAGARFDPACVQALAAAVALPAAEERRRDERTAEDTGRPRELVPEPAVTPLRTAAATRIA
jgi:diguanylate cyclase (GGDEF)-like protein